MDAKVDSNKVLADDLFVIVVLGGGLYGIPARIVDTMAILPLVTAIPEAPLFIRGVINLRGKVYPLIDLRKRLGMKSFLDESKEFCEMLLQRKQDHEKWMNELSSCVHENRSFSLATDPHKCAFGKWYYNYKSTSLVVSAILKKFENPHAVVHGIAVKVLELRDQSKIKEAQEIIDCSRDKELAEVVSLFKLLTEAYLEETREIIVVIDDKRSKPFAVVVDSIESVETLTESSLKSFDGIKVEFLEKDLLLAIGQQRKTQRLVSILNTAKLLQQS